MSYTINPNAKNKWVRNAENTMDLSIETDASSVYLDNGRTLEQEIGEGSMISNVATVDTSMSKVVDGTLDGAYESLVFKGKSLVNLAQFEKLFEVAPSVLDTQSVIWYGNTTKHYTSLSMFKPNTKYIVKIGSETPSRFRGIYISGLNMSNPNGYYTEHNGVFTTPSTIPTEANMYIKGVSGETITKTEYSKCQILILEYQEGMENWDTPYFTGLCDSKMPILRNVGSLHPFPNGLLCWYDARSGEGEQTLLEDLSGNENHATLRNFQFGGTDGWQDGGIRMVGYGSAERKNSIRTNKQIDNAKSMCIYFKCLGSIGPWYLFDGRESSTLYWYSGGYSGNLINLSKSSKNGVRLSGYNNAVLPEIGNTAMVYIEFTDNIPITPTLMGRYTENESLDGVFYAFMLYDRALTTEEVAMNMEYAKSFDHIKDISPLDFRNIDKSNILRTSEEIILREVNGVQDTYNALTGEYVKRIGEVVITSAVAKSVIVLDKNLRVNIAMSALSGDNGTTKVNNTLSDKFYWSEANARDIEGLRVNGNTFHWCISRDKLTSQDLQGVNTWLQSNPITVQYELAKPITTIVEPLTIPFAYQNGHIILESGSEGQSLLPVLEYSTVVNRTGQVESVAKVIQKQEKQLTMLEKMLIQNIINLDYNNTLLTLKNEMEEML